MPTYWQTIVAGDLPLCDVLLVGALIVDSFRPVPVAVLVALTVACLLGHVVLWFFYHRAVRTIFNAEVPSWRSSQFWTSYWEFYKLVRPVEARYSFEFLLLITCVCRWV
jgi:hypothetical protein